MAEMKASEEQNKTRKDEKLRRHCSIATWIKPEDKRGKSSKFAQKIIYQEGLINKHEGKIQTDIFRYAGFQGIFSRLLEATGGRHAIQEVENATGDSGEGNFQDVKKENLRTSALQQDWRVTVHSDARREGKNKM